MSRGFEKFLKIKNKCCKIKKYVIYCISGWIIWISGCGCSLEDLQYAK
jgi:hypothetical protein